MLYRCISKKENNEHIFDNRKERQRMCQRQYLCIDQTSFVCHGGVCGQGPGPYESKLVVADPKRSQNTLCLAVSPALKALGVRNRCRIREIHSYIQYIVPPSRMQRYFDCAAAIHDVFLKYIAPEDIYVYSITNLSWM